LTIRAVILGLLLGLLIASVTYFNDAVIKQTMLIGNFLPVAVFGTVVLGLITVNPLLRLGGERWALSGPEVALVAAIALAACGWPGSNWYRVFTAITAMPSHLLKSAPDWQAAGLMSYVPGGDASLAPGHVLDPLGAAQVLATGGQPGTVAGEAAGMLTDRQQLMLQNLITQPALDAPQQDELLRMINGLLDAGALDSPETQTPLRDRVSESVLAGQDQAADAAAQARALTDHAGELIDAVERDLPSGLNQTVTPSAGASVAESIARIAPLRERLSELDAATMDVRAAGRQLDRAAYLLREAQASGELADRWLLVEAMDGAVAPPPPGGGLLVLDGRNDPYVHDPLLAGQADQNDRGALEKVSDVPWAAWWPTIRFWGGAAIVLALGSLCLAVIVHPQWSRRELLAYPVARFTQEAVERQPGRALPDVMRERLFWYGALGVFALHFWNGVSVWTEGSWPLIPLQLNLQGIAELFPNARQINGVGATYFSPILYLSVVAFAFFLSTSVSFSLGISMAAFAVLGVILLSYGVALENGASRSGQGAMLRFGAYAGLAGMILYTGRRYYFNVVTASLGMKRGQETPGYAVWAARLLLVLLVLAVVLLRSAGLHWGWSVAFVALAMLMWLVMARVVAETGLFFMQSWWMPMGVLPALVGEAAIGPTALLTIGVMSILILGDPREAVMPYLTNALQIADRGGRASPGKVGPWLGVMVVVGLLVAGVVTLGTQYNRGINQTDGWANESLPSMPFGDLEQEVSTLASVGQLDESVGASAAERWSLFEPDREAVAWLGLGVLLVVGAALARLRLPWWPIHPVLFVVWGTYPMWRFSFSLLLGWLVKVAVVRLGGARSYRTVRPLMIGIIAGELLAALTWIVAGAAYYLITQELPESVNIFPG
jgi:hypothetical protein